MIPFFTSLHNLPNRDTYIFAAWPTSCSLDGRLVWVGKKHFFQAEAARSIFSIIQGKAAEGCGDGWDGSLPPSQVIARLLKVHARRDKLRFIDSERWTSDSERWNGVSANVVCADPDVTARLASPTSSARLIEVIELWTLTALASGRSHDSSALKLSPIPVMIDAFVPLGDQEFR